MTNNFSNWRTWLDHFLDLRASPTATVKLTFLSNCVDEVQCHRGVKTGLIWFAATQVSQGVKMTASGRMTSMIGRSHIEHYLLIGQP
jgi:hypothetical protein